MRIVLLFAAFIVLASSSARAELPAGVVARVNGKDLLERELAAFVGAETRHEAPAAELLLLMQQERVIELEAAARHVAVSDDAVEALARKLDAKARAESKGRLGMDDLLEQQGVRREEWLHDLHRLVLLDRMAREDFDLDPDEEIPPEKQTLWLQDRVARARITNPGDGEPNVLARVGDSVITTEDVGRRYLADLVHRGRRDRAFLDQLIGITVVEDEAERNDVRLTAADVERAVTRSEQRLQAKPGFEDAALDDVLKKAGRSVAALKASRRFRAQLLLERLADRVYSDAELEKYHAAHRAELDPKVGAAIELRTIFLRAGTKGARTTGFVRRDYEDAEAELTALRQRVEHGDIEFTAAAKTRSEHDSSAAGGELGAVRGGSKGLEELFAAAKDQPEGAIVGPIRTVDGVHLLQVVRRLPAPPFHSIREAVRIAARESWYRDLVARADVVRREP